MRASVYGSLLSLPLHGTNNHCREWGRCKHACSSHSDSHRTLFRDSSRLIRLSVPLAQQDRSALTLQGRYRSEILGKPAIWSISASRGEQGSNGTEWERMGQVILGLEVQAYENVTIGAEYLYNEGFVPLILPTITGDRSVTSHTLITGVRVTF